MVCGLVTCNPHEYVITIISLYGVHGRAAIVEALYTTVHVDWRLRLQTKKVC